LAANSIQKAEIQLFFLVFFLVLLDALIFAEVFFLPDFFAGAFAATISYDCRINSFNSSVRSASNRSSITHLYLPT
jgi:hypothetical protein